MLPLLAAAALAVAAAQPPPTAVRCDVIVAGGSLSSVAAAVSAANTSAGLTVCLLDPTDWLGGQLTASAVPAVDFGPENSVPANLPASFSAFLYGDLMPGATNRGHCWVSKKCFDPRLAVTDFLNPLTASFPNLRIFLRTTVVWAGGSGGGALLQGVTGVQRTPRAGVDEWDTLTSEQLADWYSPSDSPRFTKEVLEFYLPPQGGVVIEATEFGDVLATRGQPFAQGIEIPAETSPAYLSTCGQGTTVPFYVTYGRAPAASPDPTPPGDDGGLPYSQQGMSWDRDWTYRRVEAGAGSAADAGAPGESSVINVGGGNDLSNAYLFYGLDSAELAAQRATKFAWRGGVNSSALAMGEQRAYGFYHWFKANATGATRGDASRFLALNTSWAGTTHGLARMPYLRDSRRSAGGLGGFRVFKDNLTVPGAWHRAAYAWPDAVSLGVYFYADIHKMAAAACAYPDYIAPGDPVLPYYIPFRALTVAGAPNLLVAGKAMATSFFAGAAMRLHPEEWGSGVAAGVAAGLMAQHQWSTQDALEHIQEVRALIHAMGSPLNWTLA